MQEETPQTSSQSNSQSSNIARSQAVAKFISKNSSQSNAQSISLMNDRFQIIIQNKIDNISKIVNKAKQNTKQPR